MFVVVVVGEVAVAVVASKLPWLPHYECRRRRRC